MTEELFHPEKIEKLNKLKELGISPYPYFYETDVSAQDIIEKFEQYEGKKVKLAGRIISIREHGKSKFLDLRDSTGDLQLYVKKDILEPVVKGKINAWELTDYLGSSDIIGVQGEVFKTHKGEITVRVENFDVLTKALYPIPFGKQKEEQTWYSVADPEVKYRERYIYWNVYPKEREIIITRIKIINAIRDFMNQRQFVEVMTPTLEMVYGGAEARPFETKIWALDWQKAYLRISPELYLKRLLVGGFSKVYTICQNFRNEGIDRTHYPEFTMMEWYEAYTDYKYQMKQFEELINYVVQKIAGSSQIVYQEEEIDFTPPWDRLTFEEALKKYSSIDVDKESDESLIKILKQNNVEIESGTPRGILIATVFDKICQDKIRKPTFIIDHPKEISPLTKEHREKQGRVERFEPMILGIEIGNAYSELNDPQEQYKRFQDQRAMYENAEVKHHPVDMDFIKALSCGMPPTGGAGLGIDRLVMMLTNSTSIRDVLSFPMLKPVD